MKIDRDGHWIPKGEKSDRGDKGDKAQRKTKAERGGGADEDLAEKLAGAAIVIYVQKVVR